MWIRSRLESDRLLVVASRIVYTGSSRVVVFICTLALMDGFSADKIEKFLDEVMFASEIVSDLVERRNSNAAASESQ